MSGASLADLAVICRHRTLPALHDAFRTKDGMIQIVMTLMSGSNICARLAADKDFSEGQARDVFKEIAGEILPVTDRKCSVELVT